MAIEKEPYETEVDFLMHVAATARLDSDTEFCARQAQGEIARACGQRIAEVMADHGDDAEIGRIVMIEEVARSGEDPVAAIQDAYRLVRRYIDEI